MHLGLSFHHQYAKYTRRGKKKTNLFKESEIIVKNILNNINIILQGQFNVFYI